MPKEFKEKCGLVGIWGCDSASYKAYHGLYALQHRGQESAGIVSSDGLTLQSKKGMGLVAEVFKEDDFEKLPGHLAIGHVRYSTTGSTRIQNIQPLVMEHTDGLLAVAHNGNLVNARSLRRQYSERGAIFQTSTDSEIIVHILADPRYKKLRKRYCQCLSQLEGAFCFLFMTKDTLMAARDPRGFRPLCIGRLGEATVIASETCVLDLLKAEYVSDVAPGEFITVDKKGLRSTTFAQTPTGKLQQCIFEHVYFARPDSSVFGENVHNVRVSLGRRLAEEHPADADVVISVPDSGQLAALGFSQASGIPLDWGFIRNHYIGRTFIMPAQKSRASGVDIKLNIVKDVVKGKRVVVVDDSIIRGTTTKKRLKYLRQAGARELHVRISCPPTRFPCFYGIDFPTTTELIAAHKTAEEIADFLEVDSLGYLSMKGLLSAVDRPGDYCTACFTGTYPVQVEEGIDKFVLEKNTPAVQRDG